MPRKQPGTTPTGQSTVSGIPSAGSKPIAVTVPTTLRNASMPGIGALSQGAELASANNLTPKNSASSVGAGAKLPVANKTGNLGAPPQVTVPKIMPTLPSGAPTTAKMASTIKHTSSGDNLAAAPHVLAALTSGGQPPPLPFIPPAVGSNNGVGNGTDMPPGGGNIPEGSGDPAGGGAGGPMHLQQYHAIHYVTKIRNRFSNNPDTYRYVNVFFFVFSTP